MLVGVSIELFYDCLWLVLIMLNIVFCNLLEGVVLVFLVLWLFLYNVCVVLIVVVMMLLVLLLIFFGLYLWGVLVNLLLLGVMDFGIIIDGVVIVIEYIVL